MLQTSWARRASAAVAVIGAMGAIAGPASAGTTFYASTWVDDDGVAQGYVESYPGTPHAGRLDVVRAGSVVATSTGHEWGTWVETLVQPGDELVYTDLDSGQAQQVTVTGRPAFDASVCGTPGSVSGTRDPDGAVDLGAYLYFGPYDSRNDYLEGAVTTLSGEQFAGSYPKVLAPEWRVHVTQTRKLPGDVVFTTSTSRKVGACAPPAAAPAVVPVPAPAPKPPVDTGRPAGKLDVPKAVFAPAAAFRALSAGVFTTTVTVDEPGTVTQTLYLDNGAKLPGATAAARKKPVVLGKGHAVVAKPGKVKVRLKLSRTGRSRVRRARSVKLVLVTSVRDLAGNTRTLPVKRFTAKKTKAKR